MDATPVKECKTVKCQEFKYGTFENTMYIWTRGGKARMLVKPSDWRGLQAPFCEAVEMALSQITQLFSCHILFEENFAPFPEILVSGHLDAG